MWIFVVVGFVYGDLFVYNLFVYEGWVWVIDFL